MGKLGAASLPISRDEFDEGAKLSDWAKEIHTFLESHSGEAFTKMELFHGLGHEIPQEERPLTELLDFTAALTVLNSALAELMKARKVERRKVGKEEYYACARRK
jgi:hypothetical protein